MCLLQKEKEKKKKEQDIILIFLLPFNQSRPLSVSPHDEVDTYIRRPSSRRLA